MTSGGALAVASAVAFGATTPFVQRFGRGIGPFTTAALLYGGAATFAFVASTALSPRPPPSPVKPSHRAGLRASDLPRLGVVALLGAVVAPVALAWGLQRTSGITASLLLNLEAVFTVLLARLLWAEPIGGRVGLALLAMTGGGALLIAGGVVDATGPGAAPGVASGALAVVIATLAWAADNTVGRPLADRDPLRVVLAKGAMGALAAAILASAFGEGWPSTSSARAMALLGACGAGGYGASLVLYLRAQRVIGAARTGSIFAAAPFVGAAIAWGLGERTAISTTLPAGALFVVGLWLHMTESHGHEHSHDAIAHDHAHSHDDAHHGHEHDDRDGAGPTVHHAHPHTHDATTHTHPHGLDVHHRHRH
jgi:drug/metabolite transporter (DMT)-like permease